jgi:hypothetical protein
MTDGVYVQLADVTVELQTVAGVSISGAIQLTKDMDYAARYTGQIDQQHTNSLVPGTQYDLWYSISYGQSASTNRCRLYAAYRGAH